MSLPGVFVRWSVLHRHDGSPVEGCNYIHKAKAVQRMRGMCHPEHYEVGKVVVMSESAAEKVAAALSRGGNAVV